MTRRITKEIHHAAPLEAVATMLRDPDFRERVCTEQHVLSHRVDVTHDGATTRVVVEQVQAVRGVPSLVTRIVGEQLTIRQDELWESSEVAVVLVTIPDQPARVSGTTRLVADGSGTRQEIDWTITVSVPLVGKKIEGVIADLLDEAFEVEREVAQVWLAG